MKNILVKSLFRVQDTNWHFRDRKDEGDLYNKYVEMHRLSVGSFTKHLKGTWELKFVQGTVDNINDAFRHTFKEIYQLWQQGDTNILYTDPDTVAICDLDPWNISDQFMMFNFTDPKSFNEPNQYQQSFPYFFNAGVRYFPATMSQITWDLGLNMVDQWEPNTYHTEQIILNSMLWSQGVTLDQVLRPELAYQAHWLPMVPIWLQDLWNGISISRAAIIHTHSSRDIDQKLDLMRQLTGAT
jgi:hypothetical protein